MSLYDSDWHILKSCFVSKTGIFALDSSLVRMKPSRRVLNCHTQTVMPQSPTTLMHLSTACVAWVSVECDDGHSWFPHELLEVIIADTHCDGWLGHAHHRPVDHCGIVFAVKVNWRHCELSNAPPFRLFSCLQNSEKGEFTNVWSIVGHHGQQQVFGVSEVAVTLDDGVHNGLQFVCLVPRVLDHHEQMSRSIFCLMLNHVGTYTRTMNVTKVTKVSDGFSHSTYNRSSCV